MATPSPELSVRRHERYLCDLPAGVTVAPQSAGAVRVSRSAIGTNGRVQARVVDASEGGVGLMCPVFFPLTCRLRVIFDSPAGGGQQIEATVRIQRAVMWDRKPTYYLGGAFDGLSPEQARAVAAALAALRAAGAVPVPEESRA